MNKIIKNKTKAMLLNIKFAYGIIICFVIGISLFCGINYVKRSNEYSTYWFDSVFSLWAGDVGKELCQAHFNIKIRHFGGFENIMDAQSRVYDAQGNYKKTVLGLANKYEQDGKRGKWHTNYHDKSSLFVTYLLMRNDVKAMLLDYLASGDENIKHFKEVCQINQ